MRSQRIARQPDLFASECDQLDLFDSAQAAEPSDSDRRAERPALNEASGDD